MFFSYFSKSFKHISCRFYTYFSQFSTIFESIKNCIFLLIHQKNDSKKDKESGQRFSRREEQKMIIKHKKVLFFILTTLVLYSFAYFLNIVPCKILLLNQSIWTFCSLQETAILTDMVVILIVLLIAWLISLLFFRQVKPAAKTFKQKAKVLAQVKGGKK